MQLYLELSFKSSLSHSRNFKSSSYENPELKLLFEKLQDEVGIGN